MKSQIININLSRIRVFLMSKTSVTDIKNDKLFENIVSISDGKKAFKKKSNVT